MPPLNGRLDFFVWLAFWVLYSPLGKRKETFLGALQPFKKLPTACVIRCFPWVVRPASLHCGLFGQACTSLYCSACQRKNWDASSLCDDCFFHIKKPSEHVHHVQSRFFQIFSFLAMAFCHGLLVPWTAWEPGPWVCTLKQLSDLTFD